MFYVIMGVSGTGKSTVGKLLAEYTGWDFYDADDFHSAANIDKLKRGIALSDRDRLPWLEQLQQLIAEHDQSDRPGILACSALKCQYRQILSRDNLGVTFIYLRGDYQAVQTRIQQRQGHFMNSDLLRSQFAVLEEPEAALIIDISATPKEIVAKILKSL